MKLKILYILSEFVYGSKVRRVHDLVKGMDKDIFDIEIAGMNINEEALDVIKSLNVPYFALQVLPPRELSVYKAFKFLQSPLIIARKRYDIIHSLLYQSLCTDALFAKLFGKSKYIYTKTNLQWSNHFLNWYIKSYLSDSIVSISNSTSSIFSAYSFQKKITKIHSGIDTEYFKHDEEQRELFRGRLGIPNDSFIFGCAAQFVEWKNHKLLIDAFVTLKAKHDNIYLFLCGKNNGDHYYREVLKYISDYQEILCLDTLSDMPSFYSAIDCFVLPSLHEPFGYVCIEAMSCSKPVIALPLGGPLEIIDPDINGYFAENSGQNLYEKMEYYILDPLKRKDHGINGRKKVRKFFSIERMVQEHEKLYFSSVR